MPRYKLTLEYDGSRFSGWQRQQGCISVQETLEQALKSLFRLDVKVEGAGRTDAGVHALGQVAHLDLPYAVLSYRIADGLNYYLRDRGVAVLEADNAPASFHARFSAINRVYEYHIINRRGPVALETSRAWHVIKPLDIGKMQEAALHFIGAHDFTSFRSIHCQAPSPAKTLTVFEVEQVEGSWASGVHIKARVESRSFLHNQVRIMMGTLKLAGEGRLNPADIPCIFAARTRCASGPTAPPQGLFLKSILY